MSKALPTVTMLANKRFLLRVCTKVDLKMGSSFEFLCPRSVRNGGIRCRP